VEDREQDTESCQCQEVQDSSDRRYGLRQGLQVRVHALLCRVQEQRSPGVWEFRCSTAAEVIPVKTESCRHGRGLGRVLFCAASTNLQTRRWATIICTSVLPLLSPLPVFLYLLTSARRGTRRAAHGRRWHAQLPRQLKCCPQGLSPPWAKANLRKKNPQGQELRERKGESSTVSEIESRNCTIN